MIAPPILLATFGTLISNKYREVFLGGYAYSPPFMAREILQDQNLRDKYGETIQGWNHYFGLAQDNIIRHSDALVKGLESCIKQGRFKDFKGLVENHFDRLIRQVESTTSTFFAIHRTLSKDWNMLARLKEFVENYVKFAKNYNNLTKDTFKLVTELRTRMDIHVYIGALVLVKEDSFDFDRDVKP